MLCIIIIIIHYFIVVPCGEVLCMFVTRYVSYTVQYSMFCDQIYIISVRYKIQDTSDAQFGMELSFLPAF